MDEVQKKIKDSTGSEKKIVDLKLSRLKPLGLQRLVMLAVICKKVIIFRMVFQRLELPQPWLHI